MKLLNSLLAERDIETPNNPLQLYPLDTANKRIRVYTCGPTVYDHAHIGNLSSFIFADTLRRTLAAAFPDYDIQHVMNYTDVDDKIIRRSRERYPDTDPRQALQQLTDEYIALFLRDMQAIGNDTAAITFLRATETIADMQKLISDLLLGNIAYVADDGVYFSIAAYRNAGGKYGQLSQIDANTTSNARIANDEYDKDSASDFALWKKQKDNEPAWDFALPDNTSMPGRPGWHIECSAMSRKALGQPFDVHTGGVDLKFPHHENEIAQSTALEADKRMAQFFCHNAHILVDGKKMAKSANNFYTLQDITDKGYDPLAFRLLVLQGHYRSQTHFSWENLEAAQNRLNDIRAWADLRYQPSADTMPEELDMLFKTTREDMLAACQNDLNTPAALTSLGKLMDYMANIPIPGVEGKYTNGTLALIDELLGLGISNRPDISDEQKQLIREREQARDAKDWTLSDELRDRLKEQGIGVRDSAYGTIWHRLANQP